MRCRLVDGPTRDLNLMLRGVRGAHAARRRGVEPWRPDARECGLYARAPALRSRPRPTSTRRCRRTALRWWRTGAAHRSPVDRRRPVRSRGLVDRGRCSRRPRPVHDPSRSGATPAWRRCAGRARLGPDRARRAAGRRRHASRWVGAEAELPRAARGSIAEHDLGGALVTPGLVDCHTHLVYGGQRAHEFEQRLQGASYEEIARAGGGIRSTVAATRAAERRRRSSTPRRARARALMAEGVTTLEIKSGYGLSAEHEARCLRVARRLGRELPLDVRTTCLAAHALPPEFDGPRRRLHRRRLRAGCPRCTPKAWSTRSTPSASASPSRRRRRGACSTPRARSACR